MSGTKIANWFLTPFSSTRGRWDKFKGTGVIDWAEIRGRDSLFNPYSHYSQGYRWYLGGHIWTADPDNPETHPREYKAAQDKTREWLHKWWNKNEPNPPEDWRRPEPNRPPDSWNPEDGDVWDQRPVKQINPFS